VSRAGWYGADLDGFLALHDSRNFREDRIGAPIAPSVELVKRKLHLGYEVRVFTARVAPHVVAQTVERVDPPRLIDPMAMLVGKFRIDAEEWGRIVRATRLIQEWTLLHVGARLPVTCVKDRGMIELWDDRCVQFEPNTGRRVSVSAAECDELINAARHLGIIITPTDDVGFHTGRRRWRVACARCSEVLHEATTGPFAWHARHQCPPATQEQS
jgi:hypothetical protein